MKLTAVLVLVIAAALGSVVPTSGALIALAIFFVYLLLGIALSRSRGLDPLNDVPNAFRVLLAASSPVFAAAIPQPFGAAMALVSFGGALLLNDEYQRRAADSVRKGRRGGSVALLGIDGSGKSTHAEELESWFTERGYYCTRVPFHRYLFVEVLGRHRQPARPKGSRSGGNPLRPFLSAADNIILMLATSFGRGLEGRAVIYDRYIWSTYVKYAALGYPVRPLRWLFMLPRPRYAVVLDVPVEKSLAIIGSRADHIRYQRSVLAAERDEYVRIARKARFPIVDATGEQSLVQREIETLMAAAFPARGR